MSTTKANKSSEGERRMHQEALVVSRSNATSNV